MRIRLPFAGTFFVLLLIAGYAGLTSLQVGGIVNDKVLHFVTFFALTVVFYWIVDTNRRRTLNMALAVCTVGLGVGSEVLQALIPDNGRQFDAMDIVANVLGSLAGLGLCTWYHKRMLERKRRNKYSAVPGEGGDDEDLELGEGVGPNGVALHDNDDTNTPTSPSAAADTPASTVTTGTTEAGKPATGTKTLSLEDEVDNWDENAEDPWDEEDDGDIGGGSSSKKGKSAAVAATLSDEVGPAEIKKHAD